MDMTKSVLAASLALSIAVIVPNAASAKSLKPGQYDLDGIQQICLVNDGTWYYTTFAGNVGGWENTGASDVPTVLWGSYNSGVGQDAISITKKSTFNWLEFHNDGVLVNFFDQVPIAFVKKQCDAKPTRAPTKISDPAKNR